MPNNFTHVIIGGHCGLYASCTVDNICNFSPSTSDYARYHPEADMVGFFALKRFLDNGHPSGTSVIINCPEADNVTILLLQHRLISEIISTHSIKLYCAIHNKLKILRQGNPQNSQKKMQQLKTFRR